MPAKKKAKKTTAKKKTVSKKSITKKAAAKKSVTKKAVSKKTTAKKSAASKKKSTANKKAVSKKKVAKKVVKKAAKKAPAKKVAAKKKPAKKTSAKNPPTKKATTKKPSPKTSAKKSPSRKKVTTKATISKSPAKKTAVASKPTAEKRTKKVATAARSRKDVISGPIHGVAPYQPKRSEEYMSNEQLDHFRTILTAWKTELMVEVDRTVHHMQDEAANFPDPNDRATQESEFGLELRTRDRERKLLRKISQAIARIDDGSYGYCEETGEEIGLKRLEARPVATLCLEAQERRELSERQFRDRDDRYR